MSGRLTIPLVCASGFALQGCLALGVPQGDVERSPRLSPVHRHWNKHENCRQHRFAGL